MAAASVLASTKESTNYARLCRLQVDGASHVLRERFDNIYPPATLPKVLSSPAVHTVLQNLRKRKILNPQQWGKLFPVFKSTVSSNSFDITLLVVLLRNICGLTPPSTGWDCMPSPADITPEADIARIKYYRNHLYGHASEAKINDADFKKYWKEIRDVLVRLGGKKWEKNIDELESEVMDPDIEEHYIELLKDWYKDDHSILDKLDQMEKEHSEKLEHIKKKQDEILQKVEKSWNKEQDKVEGTHLHEVCQRMRASLQQFYRDEFSTIQPLPWCEDRYNMDNTYTDIVIKERKNKEYSEDVSINSMISNFTTSAPGKPKPLLIEADPGMGKTTLCHKLCYDWATKSDSVLKHFDLVLFVECCKYSSSLKETVFEQTFPEDFPISRDTIWDYVKQNEANILFVVDGYDELSNTDQQSDIVKLINGKLLRESCVLVTSRLDKSSDIYLKCKQAKCFKMFGFSNDGTNRYINEYFSKNRRKWVELNIEISQNDSLLTEVYVTPLYVMFCCLLWDDDVESPPSTVTELYNRILVLMVSLYCKKHGIPAEGEKIPKVIQADLLRLGKIALEGVQNNSNYFLEDDLNYQLLDTRIVRIGFLTKVCAKSRLSCTSYYKFTHKSFQEFVAAYFLASMIRKRNSIPEESQNVVEHPLLCSFLVGFLQLESLPVFNLFRENTVIKADELISRIDDRPDYFCTCQSNGHSILHYIYLREDKLIQLFEMLNECNEDCESIIRTCAMVLPTIMNLTPLYFCNARFSASLMKLLRVPGNPVQTIMYHFSELLCVTLPLTTLLQTLNYTAATVKLLHIELKAEYILANKNICEDISNFLKSNNTVCELHLYLQDNLQIDFGLPPLLQTKDTEIKAVLLCIEAIANALKTNTSLQTLCLSSCSLDTECLKTLLEGMKRNSSLSRLVIRCMEYIRFDGWKALHDFLITTNTLKTLDVSGTSWEKTRSNSNSSKEHDGLLAITWALEKNCSLTELVCLNSYLQQSQLRRLFKALKTNSNLNSLSVGEFDDMKRGVSWFETIFDHVKNSSISQLNISSSVSYDLNAGNVVSAVVEKKLWAEIKKDCLFELEKFIINNKTLRSLIMNYYKFLTVVDVTKCISHGLRNNSLRFLDLSWCCDGNGGDFLVRWSMSLVLDSPLEHLSLSFCQLNDSHIRYIASCIKTWSTTNCSLTFLDLSGNFITSDGLEYLMATLIGHPLCGWLKICLKPNLLGSIVSRAPNRSLRQLTDWAFNK